MTMLVNNTNIITDTYEPLATETLELISNNRLQFLILEKLDRHIFQVSNDQHKTTFFCFDSASVSPNSTI